MGSRLASKVSGTGYTLEAFGLGQFFLKHGGVAALGGFHSLGQQHNGIVTLGSKHIGQGAVVLGLVFFNEFPWSYR